jgi:hypothetical protein
MYRSTVRAATVGVFLLLVLLAAGTLGRHHRDHDNGHNGNGHNGNGDHHEDDNGDHDDDDDEDHDNDEEEEEEEHLHEEQYAQLEKRLDILVAKLHDLDEHLDERLDPERKERALSFEHRVSQLEEDTCEEHHYQCGGDDPECVSRLLVCDGVEDCRNGADEENCDMPTHPGDVFVGHVVYDRCTQRHPEEITVKITGVSVNEAYPAFPSVRATIYIDVEDEEEEGSVALPTTGYYRFATHKLVLLPPEDDRLGLVCDFDGFDNDKCVGHVVRESTLEPCAEFIFFREKEDEEDEEDHDDESDDESGSESEED